MTCGHGSTVASGFSWAPLASGAISRSGTRETKGTNSAQLEDPGCWIPDQLGAGIITDLVASELPREAPTWAKPKPSLEFARPQEV